MLLCPTSRSGEPWPFPPLPTQPQRNKDCRVPRCPPPLPHRRLWVDLVSLWPICMANPACPCAQWRFPPLGCGLPWASGCGASSALTVSPDAMCCLAGSQQMPRRALSCCPAEDRTDSHPAPSLGSCGDSGHPERVRQDAAHPCPRDQCLPSFAMFLGGS